MKLLPSSAARLFRAVQASWRFRGGAGPMLARGVSALRDGTWRELVGRARHHAEGGDLPAAVRDARNYARWIDRREGIDAEHAAGMTAEIADWASVPAFTILIDAPAPADLGLLRRALGSVVAQTYPHWQLRLVTGGARGEAGGDGAVGTLRQRLAPLDGRIRIVEVDGQESLAGRLNQALAGEAPGPADSAFAAFLAPSDVLHPMALYWIAREIAAHPRAALIYGDTDRIDDLGRRASPYFKCAFNPDLLLSHDMTAGAAVFARGAIARAGGFREEAGLALHHDLTLRVVEQAEPEAIRHVAVVTCHVRAAPEADVPAAVASGRDGAAADGRRIVTEHLRRVGTPASVVPVPEAPWLHRIVFDRPVPEPSVEIVIPTRDRRDLLEQCVGSVRRHTRYANHRFCIVDNGSTDPATLALLEEWRGDPRFRILRDDRPFNFSALNNLAVQGTSAEFVCLLNNDVETIDGDWLGEMVSQAVRPGVGCVGARLWYPDDRLQHGGVILGLKDAAGHAHLGLPKGDPGYFGRAAVLQTVSAVTAACLLVRASHYRAVGGFDERLAVAFNDVDFCLRIRATGLRNIWTPVAELRHHESRSRGYEEDPERRARFRSEFEMLRATWGEALADDPAYSPHLTRLGTDFAVG